MIKTDIILFNKNTIYKGYTLINPLNNQLQNPAAIALINRPGYMKGKK